MCFDLLFERIDMHIDQEKFKTLGTIASCNVIFDKLVGFYKQIDGLATGVPQRGIWQIVG